MKRLAICVLISYVALCFQASGQSGNITTVAGGVPFTFPTNVTALNAPLGNVAAVAVDSQGNIYIADSSNGRLFRVSPGGTITTVTGVAGAAGIAVDASGNLFIADGILIYKVSAAGVITTVAGNGNQGFSGDGGPATSAALFEASGVAVDTSGNLFIADTYNNRVRKVSASGIITTVAGNGQVGFSGDGGPATAASFFNPSSVALDASGNLFIADSTNTRIRRVSASGIVTTVAGNGGFGFSGDGGPATAAELTFLGGISMDAGGNLFVADYNNQRIRKVSASGTITTVAGNGTLGFSGDGGPATAASLYYPEGVAVDVSGNLFIADTNNDRIRKVSAGGTITTVAGNGNFGFSGDGGPATAASLSAPYGVALDASGDLFIADSNNARIRKVSASGIITTVAGNGSCCFSGDGGPATSAQLFVPWGVAVDAFGNLFIADSYNSRIRAVSATGIITTIAGNGILGFSGDGGPATSARLAGARGVAVDPSGNLFIADTSNHRVRMVSASGIITTIVGNGSGTFSGDGGPATAAALYYPDSVALDASGNLFIADSNNNRIRKVSVGGMITTVAGNGTQGFSGDGGPATAASLWEPTTIAVDASGNLFFADASNNRIRKVSTSGIITTVAGGGTSGLGDGGPATFASLYGPVGVGLDVSGNLFISDSGHNRIREVSALASSAPSLTVSPTGLSFSLTAGGSSSQQITLASIAGVPWSASASASWITLTPTSGAGPGSISVAIDTASLLPGTYSANVTISNPLASPTQEIVSVSLTLSAASLSVTPAALAFQSRPDAPAQSQSLQIGGAAGAAWEATAATSTGGAWLSVSPPAGNIPASLTALVNPGSLTAGTYQGSIIIQSPGAMPPSISVGVTLSVTAANGQGGIITTVATLGAGGVAVDASGNLYVADSVNNRIWEVLASGVITTVAGSGARGFSGDGGPASEAELSAPNGVAVDASGNLFVADTSNNRIRRVSASGIITTVAGSGTTYGYSGDGGPATSALLNQPTGVAVDGSGSLFIADWANYAVRKVSASGIITTVAGGIGYDGPLGDGGRATSAVLYLPQGVAVDASGNLFIADTYDQRIRKVSTSGIITTVAGGGNPSSGLGDGGPATSALLVQPYGVTVDGSGNLFIADTGDSLIRKVSASGIITTVAGNGSTGFSGDGGLAVAASLNSPQGVAVDASGNLFVADTKNGRIREVSASVIAAAPSITSGGIVPVDSTVSTIQPGEWVSIFGTNLASSTVTWNGDFPTSLGGTSVTINGESAYLSFVSPTQINLQAPTDTATGSVPVVVTTSGGTATSTVTLAQFGPSFLLLDSKHVAGIILRSNGSGAYGGGTFDIVGPTGTSLGYPTVAAKAGDSVVLFAVGLGPTTPAVPAGQAFTGAAPTSNPVKLVINNVSVTPSFSGISSAGLYQINLTIPAGLSTGDVSLAATVGGAQTSAVISLQ